MEGELVWAKMKGCPAWPGKISIPKPHLMKVPAKPKDLPSKWIFFFGTKSYGWVTENNIHSYVENRADFVKNIKSVDVKAAVKRIDEYITDPVKYKMNAEIESKKANISAKSSAKKSSTKKESFTKTESSTKNESSTKKESTKKESSTKRKSSEPKSKTKRAASNNGDYDETPNSKRVRHSPRIGTTSVPRPLVSTEPQQSKMSVSQTVQTIVTSKKAFGFLGIGIMGSRIVKNLLNSGHKVIVWNRDSTKSRKMKKIGAIVAMTPRDVAEQVDIIFSCVADPLASKELLFGNCGIMSSNQDFDGKGYVEMTGLDCDTSNEIADAIVWKGGRYLEAQMQGSQVQAEEGTLIILAAGDRTLYNECSSCFQAISRSSFFLGDVGNASSMYLILQMLSGAALVSLAEALELAAMAGLQQKDFLEVFELKTTAASTYTIENGRAILNKDYAKLMHLQKDIRLAVSLSEQIGQVLPITRATNEFFIHTRPNGHSEDDVTKCKTKKTVTFEDSN